MNNNNNNNNNETHNNVSIWDTLMLLVALTLIVYSVTTLSFNNKESSKAWNSRIEEMK
jgi:hypothetical protein